MQQASRLVLNWGQEYIQYDFLSLCITYVDHIQHFQTIYPFRIYLLSPSKPVLQINICFHLQNDFHLK